MPQTSPHTFHIPVMGLGYTIDTPVKVAHFGISSVISIIEDELVERMRAFHSKNFGEAYTEIPQTDIDHRAQRITAYLDLVQRIVQHNTDCLRAGEFTEGSDIEKYFLLLPDGHSLRKKFDAMKAMSQGEPRQRVQEELRAAITPGAIDVNIMAKIDREVHAKDGSKLPVEYAEGMAAFRGFALSKLHSSIVISAGYNPRIYSYIAEFPDFFPDAEGVTKKKVILKVSDLRSALIQGKILAKKGIWVSEFRIESGLNCGGHAFATDGVLMGPILEEFKENREAVVAELFDLCSASLTASGQHPLPASPAIRVTVQGGIGTAAEDQFLRGQYGVDGTGWGSPFLLVPEATNVDDKTLQQLSRAKKDDYYMSWASPLGIPFNNFRPSTSEAQRKARIAKDRPGSPCYKNFLSTNTEFTEIPICTASRQYQHLKLKQLEEQNLDPITHAVQAARITEKDCLCEGLGASVLLKGNMTPAHKLEAVAICPGPNLAYFSRIVPLKTMVDHIHGRVSLLNENDRAHMFINELKLYVDYLKREFEAVKHATTTKQRRYIEKFKSNMLQGISYYEELAPVLHKQAKTQLQRFRKDLERHAAEVKAVLLPEVALA